MTDFGELLSSTPSFQTEAERAALLETREIIHKVVPRVNHGRWIVDCPSPLCASAALVPKDSAALVCECIDAEVCRHVDIGVCGVRINVEPPADFAEIERLLAYRPSRINRNWEPGESVAELKRENLTNGVRI